MYGNVAPHAGSPPKFPLSKKQRNEFSDARLLRNTNPSVESRRTLVLLGPNVRLFAVALSQKCHAHASSRAEI